MDAFSCDECQAIYRELRDAGSCVTASRRLDGAPLEQIAAWIRDLDEKACARMRQDSNLWKAWRRLQEHRVLTGHAISVVPLPPRALSNPN